MGIFLIHIYIYICGFKIFLLELGTFQSKGNVIYGSTLYFLFFEFMQGAVLNNIGTHQLRVVIKLERQDRKRHIMRIQILKISLPS